MYSDSDYYDGLLQKNKQLIYNGIMGSTSPAEVESATFFARYLSRTGINPANYWLFLRILESNNKYIVDALVGPRDPRLLFTIIKPSHQFLNRAFQLITQWHPGQIYDKVLLAVLGIIETCYHHAHDGYKIYPIDISEINHIGKYIDAEKDQYDKLNEAVLDVLYWISGLGIYEYDHEKSMLAKHAHNIRMAYFDNTKRLVDIIPHVLLVRLKREETETKPSSQFLAFLEKLPNT
ncbi:MAG: hypothetical protein JW874_14835 [Spirochaetales bacterium]|nr:hypothetical protein [Spirochaetales bacterium]